MALEVDILPEEHRHDFAFFRIKGPRHSLSVAPYREWLNDPDRPGYWSLGQRWLADEGNLSPRDCIEFAITDPDVAFEFKMRWV